jgi:hypothetical protein
LPTWGQLLKELGDLQAAAVAAGTPPDVSPHDALRRKYLTRLSERTGRTTILYYSGWLESPDAPPEVVSVGVSDMTGFMEACSNVVDSRELDLFIHSPGGDPDAAEQICDYLRTQFDHIRAVVPVLAMSAATMIALSADEILMGAHSQLGPIDPQFTIQTPEGPRSASAQAIKDQFELARQQCQDPANLPAWMPILRTLAPGLLAACDHAADRARKIVAKALEQHMFKGLADPATTAGTTAEWFGNAEEFLSHGRPVRREEAREHDVVISDLEDDSELQDAMLSVHHAAMHTLSGTPTSKLIENDQGRAWLQMGQTIQLPIAAPVPVQPPQLPGPARPNPGLKTPPKSRRRKGKRRR